MAASGSKSMPKMQDKEKIEGAASLPFSGAFGLIRRVEKLTKWVAGPNVIKLNGRPICLLYKAEQICDLASLRICLNLEEGCVWTVAKEDGFQVIRGGIEVICQRIFGKIQNSTSLPKSAVTKTDPGSSKVHTERAGGGGNPFEAFGWVLACAHIDLKRRFVICPIQVWGKDVGLSSKVSLDFAGLGSPCSWAPLLFLSLDVALLHRRPPHL